MIEGLKLTISGEERRRRLEAGANEHLCRAYRWKCEESRTPESETGEAPLWPEDICRNEAERHEWRAAVLSFIRDHIDAAESYRLGEQDLACAELLPECPGGCSRKRTTGGLHAESGVFARAGDDAGPRSGRLPTGLGQQT